MLATRCVTRMRFPDRRRLVIPGSVHLARNLESAQVARTGCDFQGGTPPFRSRRLPRFRLVPYRMRHIATGYLYTARGTYLFTSVPIRHGLEHALGILGILLGHRPSRLHIDCVYCVYPRLAGAETSRQSNSHTTHHTCMAGGCRSDSSSGPRPLRDSLPSGHGMESKDASTRVFGMPGSPGLSPSHPKRLSMLRTICRYVTRPAWTRECRYLNGARHYLVA
ncbi:hypothetical protein GGR52DRAFT_445457 [Hypoxylon sp. FL1284]|nr:hypothetical protein GGR52DRAFT_445457 [Hypoxylon sp. FL1284]